MKKLLVLLLCLCCLFACACGSGTPEGVMKPGTEEPGTEEPGTEEPGTEEPGTEEPGTEEPGTEEPGTEEPDTEEPGTEEPGSSEYVTPVVRIDVAGKQEITSKEEYLPATVTLTDETGTVTLNGVGAGVRGRGNYTWTLPKKGYRIKFDSKQKMLSEYKCKSWAILPNYTDKTLLRNYYAFQTARGMDGLDWATDAKLLELYLNGAYMGVYLLCDQTQVDKNRVNVTEDSLDADTGFLIERDRYAMDDPDMVEGRDYFTIAEDYFDGENIGLKSGPLPYVLKSPEYPDESDYATPAEFNAATDVYYEQFNYIKDYVTQAFRAALRADCTTFADLCDVNSFVDYFLLDQVTSNYEISRFSSFYLHKDKGGKLVAGPVWDFDIAAGYANFDPSHDLVYGNNWFITLGHSSAPFRKLYADRLQKHSATFKEQAFKLPEVAQKNKEAIERNNARWPLGEQVYPMPNAMFAYSTYEEQLDYFIRFISTRVDFLNQRLINWH